MKLFHAKVSNGRNVSSHSRLSGPFCRTELPVHCIRFIIESSGAGGGGGLRWGWKKDERKHSENIVIDIRDNCEYFNGMLRNMCQRNYSCNYSSPPWLVLRSSFDFVDSVCVYRDFPRISYDVNEKQRDKQEVDPHNLKLGCQEVCVFGPRRIIRNSNLPVPPSLFRLN